MTNNFSFADNAQTVTLRHNDIVTEIPQALLRRFRHRLYSQVSEVAVPVNFAHWYFVTESPVRPLPGDEITESGGTVWTVLEVNRSPMTGVWQCVSETFEYAEPAECVDHLRQSGSSYIIVTELLPARCGAVTATLGEETQKTMTMYVQQRIEAEHGDVLRRSDQTLWKIIRIDYPLYRTGWTAIRVELVC